jgi:hypothetical protein
VTGIQIDNTEVNKRLFHEMIGNDDVSELKVVIFGVSTACHRGLTPSSRSFLPSVIIHFVIESTLNSASDLIGLIGTCSLNPPLFGNVISAASIVFHDHALRNLWLL